MRYYQWRAKDLSFADYARQAAELREQVPGLAQFSNDHWLPGTAAAGFHLGQSDLAALTPAMREKLRQAIEHRPDYVLGLSTHNSQQIRAALAPDESTGVPALPWRYLALGPCFPTRSKPGGQDPVLSASEFVECIQTLSACLARVRPQQRRFPLVLIGGITAQNVEELLGRMQGLDDPGCLAPVVAVIGAALEPGAICELVDKIRQNLG